MSKALEEELYTGSDRWFSRAAALTRAAADASIRDTATVMQAGVRV